MTKVQQEMLALADKIEHAIKTEGEITLFQTNGTRVVYVLRTLAAQPQTPSDVAQHVAWLNQYIIGMDENNWKDMRLRAERQLDGLSVALSISRPVRNTGEA